MLASSEALIPISPPIIDLSLENHANNTANTAAKTSYSNHSGPRLEISEH